MARVTVEDCLEHVDDRFSLVHLAAQRAKQLKKGVGPFVKCDNREVVTALREIAEGLVMKAAPAAAEGAAESETPEEKVKEVSHG